MELNERELAAVLAGLRILQLEMEFGSPTYLSVTAGLMAVLTDDNTLKPLTVDEIDELCEQIGELCERLNTGG